MHPLRYLSLIFVFLFSCNSGNRSQPEGDTGEKAVSISFEKLDSVKIDYLGNPTVHDIDPQSGTILFMEHRQSSEDIMVADFEGEILASFSKLGDVPDGYGKLMSTLRIENDESFLVYGYNGFMTYDFTGELQSKEKLKTFRVPNFTRKSMGFGMEKWEGNYLYIDQGSSHIDYYSLEAYNEMRLLNWLDPKTGAKEPFIQFPENSIFKSGKYFFRDSWAPAFTLADDKIYVVFGIEPVIYVFETSPPYSLLSSIPVELEDYRYFNGSIDKSVDGILRFTSGQYIKYQENRPDIVIAYFLGYPVHKIKSGKREQNPSGKTLLFGERMLKKNYYQKDSRC